MKKFIIPVSWSLCADMEIEAETIEQAIEIANESELPNDGEYIDGSFEVNFQLLEILNNKQGEGND